MPLYKFLMFWILLLVSSSSKISLNYAFLLSLKCLLTSRLTLLRISTFLWLGSFIHCILAHFLWSKKTKHSSSNQALFCFNSCRPRLSFAEVCIFSLMFSQVLRQQQISGKTENHMKFPHQHIMKSVWQSINWKQIKLQERTI